MQVTAWRNGHSESRIVRQATRRCELTDDVGNREQSGNEDASTFPPEPAGAAPTKRPPVVNGLVSRHQHGQAYGHLLSIEGTHVQTGCHPQLTRSQDEPSSTDAQV